MAMKRGYTAMEYKSTVRKLRAIRPDLRMSSGLHRRLPGETEEDHAKLMKLMDDMVFDNLLLHLQPAPGTPQPIWRTTPHTT